MPVATTITLICLVITGVCTIAAIGLIGIAIVLLHKPIHVPRPEHRNEAITLQKKRWWTTQRTMERRRTRAINVGRALDRDVMEVGRRPTIKLYSGSH